MATKATPAPTASALDRLPPVAKAGVGVLFVALFGALYFVMFYSDVASEISSAQGKESTLVGQLGQANTSKDAYQKDLEEKARREQLAREQKKILPDESETPAFLSSLQSVATSSGVNLTSWSPTTEIPQEFFAKVPMKLSLKGKFHQVVKFFHGVGQLDRIINIEDIQLKTPKVDHDEVEVQVECLATAFRSVRQGEKKATAARKPGGH